MENNGVTEDEAYKKLRSMAMSGNLKIVQVAKNVILMHSDTV